MNVATRPRATLAGRQRRPVFRSIRILKDATPDQLAEAVQRNQAEWIHFEGQHLPGVELHADRDVTWVCSDVTGRPNSVAMARFSARDADARIQQIVRRYKQLDASTVWWVGPHSAPAELAKHLRGAGFHCFKHFPGMALDLRQIGTGARVPAQLKLAQVSDFDIFEHYEHPFFGPMTTDRRRNFLEGERVLCGVEPRRAFAFIAAIAGEPLGHALLFLGAGVAGIYDVGVVRRSRGRGIGKAVTVAALKHAARLGYRYAVLQASGEGEQLYRKIGFEEACRISLWFHSRRHHGDEVPITRPLPAPAKTREPRRERE
jgi:ribosomal protein S18 acetylase RimI-like enzyme